ncbi:MAG: nickel-dependent lactate racemase [Ktedonobacteraceae bacterium]|nr:nickel-dependent lactate racemase [Ktedonobacteraceae bacterium]
MQVKIPYGSTQLDVRVPENATILHSHPMPLLADERNDFVKALREPIGASPLAALVRSDDRIAIIISDITRPTPNERIVPWLLAELAHVPRSQFVIINGTGSHRANTREELIQMLGEDVVNSVEIVNHDAFDPESLVYLGLSASSVPIWINRRYVEVDFRIVTGFIEPHFFAGFSGGAKGIIPGLAGIQTIQALHNARLIGDESSTWAMLKSNPIHQGIQDAVRLSPPEFMVNVTLDQERHITAVFAGDYIQAHYAGCAWIARKVTQAVDAPFDIVITSNNGYPLDQNLYQSVKGMTAAAQIVRPGGAIIAVAECRDGLPEHGNYKTLLQMRESPAALLELINSPDFQMHDQWQVQKQALVQLQADVYLHSSLSDDVVRAAQLLPASDLQGTLDQLLQRFGSSARVAVLPEGPVMVPYVAATSSAR